MATNQPLTFTAERVNSTFQLKKIGTPTEVSLEYSTDSGANWSTFTVGTTYTLAAIGDTFQLRATSTNGSGMGQSDANYHKFWMSGKIAASGNIMSLYDVDFATKNIAMTQYGFYYLFSKCSSLASSPELPATTLANNCYEGMFRECGYYLTKAPELPATSLANNCYYSMFKDCTPLTQAPELPATTLATYCYGAMFSGCISLKIAPKLPATTLVSKCYYSMFNICPSLNSVTAAISSTDLNSGSYTVNWLNKVASEGTFTYLNEDFDPNSITRSANTVPTGWTIEAAPSSSSDFHLMGKLVKELFIQGKKVKTLFINGKRAL